MFRERSRIKNSYHRLVKTYYSKSDQVVPLHQELRSQKYKNKSIPARKKWENDCSPWPQYESHAFV